MNQKNKSKSRTKAGTKAAYKQQNGGKGSVSSPGIASKTANVGRTKSMTIGAPKKEFLANGNMIVRHTEFLGKVAGSVDFGVTSRAINPGLPQNFKWLSPIANQYESYMLRKLHYEFVNSKAGTFAGEVILGVDYDASDANPFSEDELQSYWGCKTGQICQPLLFKADVKSLNKVPLKFTRMGALGADQDIKLYDAGNFFVATTDCADTSTIGRMYVHYDVEFQTPNTNSSNVLSEVIGPVTETQAAPLGVSFAQVGTMSCTWISGTTFRFDVPGQYLVAWNCTGTVITAGVRITSNTGISVFTNGPNVIDSGALNAIYLQYVKVASSTDVFTVASTATTITLVNARVTNYTYSNG